MMRFRSVFTVGVAFIIMSSSSGGEVGTNWTEKIDATQIVMKSLGISGLDLDSVDVRKNVADQTSLQGQSELTVAIIYKLYGTISETYPKARDDRVIKYKAAMVAKEDIFFAKQFLMDNALGNQNENLRAMSYFSLGHAFTDDQSVVLWLFRQFCRVDIPIDERAPILDALDNASGDRYRYISSLAFKDWLTSDNQKEIQKALQVLMLRRQSEEEYLPDLIVALLSENTSIQIEKSLLAVLKSYEIEVVLKYRGPMKEASEIYTNNQALVQFSAWLQEQ